MSETSRCAICTRLFRPDLPKCPFCGAESGAALPPAQKKAPDPARLVQAMADEADGSRGPSRLAVWLAATGCSSALLAFFLWPGPEGSYRMSGIAGALAVVTLALAYLWR